MGRPPEDRINEVMDSPWVQRGLRAYLSLQPVSWERKKRKFLMAVRHAFHIALNDKTPTTSVNSAKSVVVNKNGTNYALKALGVANPGKSNSAGVVTLPECVDPLLEGAFEALQHSRTSGSATLQSYQPRALATGAGQPRAVSTSNSSVTVQDTAAGDSGEKLFSNALLIGQTEKSKSSS